MNRRLLCVAIVVALAFSLTGCDALQRKLTKKKKTVKAPRIFQEKKYEKKPTPELYEKHFAFWQSWSSEILQDLGDNHKKDVQCIEQLIGQLNDMKNILVPEKAQELAKHIAKYEQARDVIVREELSQYNKNFVQTTLDRENRLINNDFCISRVKNYLRKSFDDDAVQAASAQPRPPVQAQAPADLGSGDQDERVPDDRVVTQKAQ